MPERVMIFIDGSNLYKSAQKGFGRTDIDLRKLITCLARDRELLRTYYYNAPIDPAEDPKGAQGQQRFFSVLGWIPLLEKRMGKLLPRDVRYKCPHCGKESFSRTHVQKGVDTRICVDLILTS